MMMNSIQRLMSTKRRAWNTLLSLGLALLGLGLFLGLLDNPPQAVRALGPASTWEFPGPCGATLQACIDNATDGDTVIVVASSQASGLAIDKPLTLDGGGQLGVQGTSPALTITADNVTVRGATFTGTAGSPVILIQGASTATLQVVTVTNGGTAGVLITGTVSSGHLITGSLIYSNSGPGIHLVVTTTLRLVDSDVLSNTVTNGAGGGLRSEQSGTSLGIERSCFRGNAATGGFSPSSVGGGLYVEGSVTLSGAQVSGNTARWSGGGLRVKGNVALTGVQVVNNTAGVDGGGLWVGGSAVLSGTQVISNAAGWGGGLYQFDTTGWVSVTNSCFERNVATGIGGGLHFRGNAILRETQVVSNTAEGGGGLFQNGSGRVSMISCLLQGNVATSQGGGLYAWETIVLSETQVVSNTASESGGGLYWLGYGMIETVNTLFADNIAPLGAGLYLQGDSDTQARLRHVTIARATVGGGSAVFVADSTVSITNTIIASYTIGISQTGGTINEDYNLYFGSVVSQVSAGGIFSAGVHSLEGLDPLFVNPAAGDYHIDSGSAAVDAGANTGILWDMDGDPRPTGSGYDIGADERPGASLHLRKAAQPAVLSPGGIVTYTIEVSNPGVENTANTFLTDTLPIQLRVDTITSSQGSCIPGSGWGAQVICSLGALVADSTLYVTLTAEATTTLQQPLHLLHNAVQAQGGDVASEAYVDVYLQGCYARVNGDLPEYADIQAAIDAASEGDTVMVAGQCVLVNDREDLAQVAYINKTITVCGGYTTTNWSVPYPITQPTTLDATGQGRVLYVTGDVSPTIEGLHITGGDANGLGGGPWGEDAGGGAYVFTATVTVRDSLMFGNAARYGGGLYAGGSVALEGTQVLSNTGRYGGGLYQYSNSKQVDLMGGRFERNEAVKSGGGLLVWGSAVLSGAEVVSNTADNGGGIYIVNSAILTEMQLTGNTAEWHGGGLYQHDSGGQVEVTGGRFESNVATQYYGGGLYVSGSTALNGIHVLSNTAGWRGGGLYQHDSGGRVEVTGGCFERNVATQYYGGGLYVEGSAALAGTEVVSNTAGYRGGGLYVVESVDVTDSHFEGNIAANGGGGLYVEGNAVLTGTQVVSNTAGWEGGGLYVVGNADVTSGRFERNVANPSNQSDGGGLHVEGSALLSGTQVVSNTAGSFGGGLWVGGNVNVTNGLFEHNVAANSGGGGCVWDNATLTETVLVSNTAEYSGGGLFVSGNLNVTGGRFERNIATQSYGGGLFVGGNVALTGTQLLSNTAGGYGGGLHVDGNADVTSGRFEGNVAGSNGGGLYAYGSAFLTETQVVSNTAELAGGGLLQYDSSGRVDVISGRFERNVATQWSGGGLYVRGSAVLTGTQVVSNTAGQWGGGLQVDGNVGVTGSHLEHNVAVRESGGGLCVGGSAVLTETQVVSNTAGTSGGGLYQPDTGEQVRVTGGCFQGNVANGTGLDEGGGGLCIAGSVTISGTHVVSNTAGWNGGGLYQTSSSGHVDVSDGCFGYNVAMYGGGLHVRSSATLSGIRMIGNTAKQDGGGLFQFGASEQVDVTGGRFENNEANGSGGGLWVWGNVSLSGTHLLSNTASYEGGGLYGVGGVKAVNDLFVANTPSGLQLYGASGGQTLHSVTIAHPAVCGGSAIRMIGCTASITNTIIASYTVGILQDGGTLHEDYNLYYGNGTPIVSTGGTLVTGTHSLYDLDPRFVDPASGDYHLAAGSPAIDAGTPNGAPALDIDGDARPQGDGYDIGADEYSGECLVYLPLALRNY
jgi:uncharacterized repeat protein (TIGR01451 family)